MVDLPLGPLAPDLPDLNMTTTRTARNVLPTVNGWKPMPSLQRYSGASALGVTARGLVMAREAGGSFATFAGSAAKLWKFSGTSWSDYTRLSGGAYACAATDLWRYAQWGDQLIAVNPNDAPQKINIDSGTAFTALGGTPPQARNVSIVGPVVVLSGLTGDPYSIHHSAIEDFEGWTVGTGLSDVQDFKDGGFVTGVAGGEVGFIFQEYAIRRMVFQPGSDYTFTIEKVVDGKGCVAPYGLITIAGTAFFIAEDGVYSYGDNGINPLGQQRVNDWFLASIDTARMNQILAVNDPFRPRIYWHAYASASSTAYDFCLGYDWFLDRFFQGQISGQVFGASAVPATGIDSISGNIDTMTTSFDSRIYQGGRPAFAGFDTSGYLSFLDGPNMEATIETAEITPLKGWRSFTQFAEPIVDTAAAVVSVATRERMQDDPVQNAECPVEEDGFASILASGRYQRFTLRIPAAETWTTAQGLGIEAVAQGR